MCVTFLTVTMCYSQDVITLKSGEEIKSKILEVGKTQVKYKKFSNQMGPTFIVEQPDVLMIRYEDGSIAVNTNEKEIDEDSSALTGNDLYAQGQQDATRFYRPKFTGTFLVTALVNPLMGLIPAITCSANPPREYNLNYPSSVKMKNPDYRLGYMRRAHRMKKGKVWGSFITGTCVYVAIIATYLAASAE